MPKQARKRQQKPNKFGLWTTSAPAALLPPILAYLGAPPAIPEQEVLGWAPMLPEGKSLPGPQYSLDDGVLKLLGAPPLADTGQAVGVVAVGEDAEPPLRRRRLLQDHLHADAAHLVLAGLEGEGLLHLMLKRGHADLWTERGGSWDLGGRHGPSSALQVQQFQEQGAQKADRSPQPPTGHLLS